jgi:hypothetical protein
MNALPIAQAMPIRRLACARCGATFECGSGGRDGACWCAAENFRMPMPANGDEECVCPICLRAAALSRVGRPR